MTVNQMIGDLPSVDRLSGLWIVMDGDMAEKVTAASDGQHRLFPIATDNGRFVLCADMLSEAIGGIYQGVFLRLLGQGFGSLGVIGRDEWNGVVDELPEPNED